MGSRSITNFGMLTALLSDYPVSEQEHRVLFALYAQKSFVEEKEVVLVSRKLEMSPAFVRHYHDEALGFLKSCISPARFSALFGSGKFLPSSRAMPESVATESQATMAIIIEQPAAEVEAVLAEVAAKRVESPATGIATKLPRLSRFELLVLSLSFGYDGVLRSKEAIAEDLRQVVKDDELLQQRLITERSIAYARERGTEKLRACGISVWHYFARRLFERVWRQDDQQIEMLPANQSSILPEQMRIKVDTVLNSLRPQARRCLHARCTMTDGRPRTNWELATQFETEKRPIKHRTIEKHFEDITKALKGQNISLWTIALAETNGCPEVLVSKK